MGRLNHPTLPTSEPAPAARSLRNPRGAFSVVVVGGGLTGLAAAARLAKLGHHVTLLEARAELGGAWASRAPQAAIGAARTSDAPSVIGFPAPWRDLFRKSGRPLETELERAGRALLPAPPAVHRFSDGAELVLPTDRGEQYAVLRSTYGPTVADYWRKLLDRLDDTWQALRPLGLEGELISRHQIRAARPALLPKLTLARLADAAPHPHLRAIVRSIGYRMGSLPEQTPAWCAVELSVIRRFGRWAIDDGRTEVLLDLLIRRTELRRVETHLDAPVTRVELGAEGVIGVSDASGAFWAADAVICTADVWHASGSLLPHRSMAGRGTGRAWSGGLRPAHAPRVTHHPPQPRADRPAIEAGTTGSVNGLAPVGERVELSDEGVPLISWSTPSGVTVHDFRDSHPDPSWGPRWRHAGRFSGPFTVPGTTEWLGRPPIRAAVPGLLLAGAGSPAGAGPSQVLLSAALASAACDGYAHMSVSSGEDRAS